MKTKFLISAAVLLLITSCSKEGDVPLPGDQQFIFDFESNDDGWWGDFADYYPDDAEIYRFVYERAQLPSPLDQSKHGLRIGADNRSDDVFMYLVRQIKGLEPETPYEVYIRIHMGSNVPTGQTGIGGAPDAVMLKAGAVPFEPRSVLLPGEDPPLQMNLDKGNQSMDGADMSNLGTIGAAPNTDKYHLITFDNFGEPFSVSTDSNGMLWICIGTDSGFEGRTELYYDAIEVGLKKL